VRDPVVVVDVEWTTRKWSGALHRRVCVTYSARTPAATWARIAAGEPVDDSSGRRSQFPAAAVVCFARGEWWNAVFLDGHTPDLHVDIAMPVAISDTAIETIDLDLDVVRSSGVVEITDRVEFEHNRPFYPQSVVDRAEATAGHVAELIEAHAFPFDGSHRRHRADERPH